MLRIEEVNGTANTTTECVEILQSSEVHLSSFILHRKYLPLFLQLQIIFQLAKVIHTKIESWDSLIFECFMVL